MRPLKNHPKTRAPQKATLWQRRNEETLKFEHNHVELGWVRGDKPVGKFDHQTRGWSRGVWKKELVMLIGKGRKVERPLL